MGGPLLDLDGRAVGILIARADRVTTFAIPKDHVLTVLAANPP
jgi:S1-C subfamily serine protease